MAEPAASTTTTSSSGPTVSEAGQGPKFYTITASLREEYDDNIFTSNTGKVGSFETDISPSILVNFPMEDSDFSARYTFDGIYYEHRPGGSFDNTHEFVAQYKHSFSDRFGFNIAEQFRYFTDPSLFESTGTVFRNGAYYSNTINTAFSAQWTPLFSTLTSFSNTVVKYEDGSIAFEQDYMENTGSQNFSFAILPKVNVVFGGILDTISYDDSSLVDAGGPGGRHGYRSRQPGVLRIALRSPDTRLAVGRTQFSQLQLPS